MSDIAHPLWIEPWPLVLASASPTRADMLRRAGVPVEIAPADIDERELEHDLLRRGAKAADIAVELAAAKAFAVSALYPRRPVLGADQILALGSDLLSKPPTLADARKQLLRLRDRRHTLYSAAVLAVDGKELEVFVSEANLSVRAFSEEFLDRYLGMAADHATTSVGSYRIESEGLHLFDRIEGDHSTVLGLPLMSLLEGLRRRGMVMA